MSPVADPVLRDPYTRYRRVLLTPDEVRDLSKLDPARVLRDIGLLWLQIVAAWIAVGIWTHWWTVLLAIPFVGTRFYALLVIGHDGIHRRLLPDARQSDLLNDLCVLGPLGAITRINGQNHLLHHRLLANESDPDRHKYTSSNKTTVFELTRYLVGLGGLARQLQNVFVRPVQRPSEAGEAEVPRGGARYALRDVAILCAWQAVLVGGLTFGIGWWAYPLLWIVPVYVFVYCGDQIRFFLEHAHAEPDATADERRLITYTSHPLELLFFAPNNMNLHAAHHLWTSIPYYALPHADRLVRERPGAEGLIWRKSYLSALVNYFRALPLPGCRRS